MLVRDLRDVCVSYASWAHKPFSGGMTQNDKEKFCALPNIQEKVNWILNHEYEDDGPKKWGFHLANQAELACRFMNNKNVKLVRFENLVGSRGGGSDQAQLNELRKIAKFINAPIKNDEQKLKELRSLFWEH